MHSYGASRVGCCLGEHSLAPFYDAGSHRCYAKVLADNSVLTNTTEAISILVVDFYWIEQRPSNDVRSHCQGQESALCVGRLLLRQTEIAR